jgi:23S rRNA pseudouridine2605 synthase
VKKARIAGKDRVTLDRAFSKLGILSRADAMREIQSGKVTVNGKIIRRSDHWVSLMTDRVHWKGRLIRNQKKLYFMLYKPRGVVTTYGDPDERKTVYDYLSGIGKWVFPVGRLDMDTSGLLIITNDTEFGESITRPGYKVHKTYQVKVNFLPTAEDLRSIEKGIVFKDGTTTLPAKVTILKQGPKFATLEIVLVEGKNRQVRKMIEALGGRVLKLVRTRIGKLKLGDLQVGCYRQLSAQDLRLLREPPE